jgi:probable O-glycosylation ligase (exosortase A-associated)
MIAPEDALGAVDAGSGRDRASVRGRDGLAFVAAVGFALSLQTSIVNLLPFLESARPALSAAALAAAALLFGRVASGRALTWDGGRGLSLIALSLWALASTLWSVEPATTRSDAVELLKLSAIYLTLVNLLHTPRRLLFMAVVALLASLAPSLGTIDHWRRGVDLLEGYRARWLGVYYDPNHLAMSLVAVVPIALSLLASSKSALLRLGAALAGALAIAAVVLTHSRGGALGLALAVLLWAITGKRRIRGVALASVLCLLVALLAPKSFWARTETIADYGEDASAQGRVWAWEVTAAISKDRPLTGVGAGAFRFAWPRYAPPEARREPLVAHNVFLAELGELGLIGFALLLAFVSSALAGAVRAFQHPEIGSVARGLLAGFAGYVLCSMMSGFVLSAHLFFLAALAASCERALEPVARRTAPASAAGAFA